MTQKTKVTESGSPDYDEWVNSKATTPNQQSSDILEQAGDTPFEQPLDFNDGPSEAGVSGTNDLANNSSAGTDKSTTLKRSTRSINLPRTLQDYAVEKKKSDPVKRKW